MILEISKSEAQLIDAVFEIFHARLTLSIQSSLQDPGRPCAHPSAADAWCRQEGGVVKTGAPLAVIAALYAPLLPLTAHGHGETAAALSVDPQ